MPKFIPSSPGRLSSSLILQFVTFSSFASAAGKGDKPNIVFILCDDMGYGDLACYGQPYIATPHIDRIAAEGMRFTQAYAGSPVSAPSRASIMTGQHSGHGHVRGNREYWPQSPKVRYGVNEEYGVVGQEPYAPGHVVLPEVMRRNGYATGMFGKWAGGYEGSHSTPDKRGVDEFFGYICQFQAHLYYPNFLNRYSKALGDTAVVRVMLEDNVSYPMFGDDYRKRTAYSADLIHQEALRWLDKQEAGQPFFGFFTYTLPHAELAQPNDSILQHYKRQFFHDKTWGGNEPSRYNEATHTHAEFAAMITRLDAYVGEIMEKLKEKGLDRNTIVIFSSDNGPHEEGGADPAFFGRDGKLKGLTFCELVGDKGFPKRYLNRQEKTDCFDGISFAPTLLGREKKQQAHDFLYWEFHETDQIGVRMGDWKLVVVKGVPRLYNLAIDIHEDHDLADDAHRDVVRQMIDVIYREHRPSELFPVTLPKRE